MYHNVGSEYILLETNLFRRNTNGTYFNDFFFISFAYFFTYFMQVIFWVTSLFGNLVIPIYSSLLLVNYLSTRFYSKWLMEFPVCLPILSMLTNIKEIGIVLTFFEIFSYELI